MVATPGIRLDRVTLSREGVTILTDVCGDVLPDQITAIIGPNGAGKSSLINVILGLMDAQAGTVSFLRDGVPCKRPRIGFVPQRMEFDRGAPIRVLDLFAMARQRRPLWLGATRESFRSATYQLERVQAGHLWERPLGKLSGGELQRVHLALALQHKPEILVLDEPASGIDPVGERLFCDVLDQVQQADRLTVLMVSHDLSVVDVHADHVICLNRTVVCQGTPKEVLRADRLVEVFGPHSAVYHIHPSSTAARAVHDAHAGCRHE